MGGRNCEIPLAGPNKASLKLWTMHVVPVRRVALITRKKGDDHQKLSEVELSSRVPCVDGIMLFEYQ